MRVRHLLWRGTLALALAFSLLAIPKPAAAYGPMNGSWQPLGRTVYYCESSPGTTFPYRSMWNTLKAAFSRWNGLGQITLAETTGSPACNITVFYTAIGPPAQTAVVKDISGHISYAQIYFNSTFGSDFWWYGAIQSCYVGISPGCHMDAYTIAMHEMGHAIGLTHNTSPPTDQRCVTGYYSTGGGSGGACGSSYGIAVMHWNSGAEFTSDGIPGYVNQGYRHANFSNDDLGAFHQVY